MIHDLDQTLDALLKSELLTFGSSRVEVSFAAPDDQFSVRLPAVDLFLYDLRENLELRGNDDAYEELEPGKVRRRQPPVRVDASYLITAWPGGDRQASSQDEHRLLGAVMRVLLRHRKLPREMLKGSLASQELPLPVSTLHPGRLQSLGEFWQALGGKPKAALNYTVTFAVDANEPTEPLTRVTDKELRVGTWPDPNAAPADEEEVA
jgi:hypothetical protein